MKRKLTRAGLVLLGVVIVAILILANAREQPAAQPAHSQIIVTTGGSVVVSPAEREGSRPTVVAEWPRPRGVPAKSNSAPAVAQPQ